MKQLIHILLLALLAGTAHAQFTPPASDRSAVTVDSANTLIAPTAAELLTANPGIATTAAAKYPVFVLTPPASPPESNEYTDFELKASRTNFAGATSTDKMVYYYHSPGTTGSEIGTEPDVWYTDSGHTDPREWKALPSTQSIAANLSDFAALPGGIIVVVTDPAVIDSSGDSDLVWSMVWFAADGPQDDFNGRPIWRAVTPTRYVPATFEP